MAELKYDVTGVEAGADFSIPFPIGPYDFIVEEIELTQSGKSGEDMLKIVLQVRKGDHKGRKVWEYIVLDGNQDFRLKGFVEALGIKEKGTIKKLIAAAEGAKLSGIVKIEGSKDDEFGEQNKIKSFIAADGEADEDEADEPADEPDETSDDEDETAEADDGGEDEYTWSDLEGMDRDELVEFIGEQESDTDADEYEDDDDGLREALAEEFGIEVKKKKQKKAGKKSKAKKAETPDYNEMTLAELKEAASEADVSSKGTKKVLIKRLEKAAAGSAGGDEPF